MKHTRIFLFIASLCFLFLVGCETNSSPAPPSDTTDTVVASPSNQPAPIRTVTTIDIEIAMEAFRQVSETDGYSVTEETMEGMYSPVLTSTTNNGCHWQLYSFDDVSSADAKFEEFVQDIDTLKASMKGLTYELSGATPERSIAAIATKKSYFYQVIQQDNILFVMQGPPASQEILYAFTTQYFYAISPYLPSSLEQDDRAYMPEINELIDSVTVRLQKTSELLKLPAVHRENGTADTELFGNDKTVTLKIEDANFALSVILFDSPQNAIKYVEETSQFYQEYDFDFFTKEDDFGTRYVFPDLGSGTYYEMICDEQTVITALALDGDRDYVENAIATYIDLESQLATESSEH